MEITIFFRNQTRLLTVGGVQKVIILNRLKIIYI